MADRFMPVTGGITYMEHGGADEEVKIRVKAIDNAESGLKDAGRVFYVSPNGNNENEGTSPESPCKPLRRYDRFAIGLSRVIPFCLNAAAYIE